MAHKSEKYKLAKKISVRHFISSDSSPLEDLVGVVLGPPNPWWTPPILRLTSARRPPAPPDVVVPEGEGDDEDSQHSGHDDLNHIGRSLWLLRCLLLVLSGVVL